MAGLLNSQDTVVMLNLTFISVLHLVVLLPSHWRTSIASCLTHGIRQTTRAVRASSKLFIILFRHILVHSWKHRFSSECMSVVHDQAFGARTPTYATILQVCSSVHSDCLLSSCKCSWIVKFEHFLFPLSCKWSDLGAQTLEWEDSQRQPC